MKKITLLLAFILIFSTSCGITYNYNKFYNAHKNDMNSTAFQMPRFLSNILGELSPEMNSFFNNMSDFKFIVLEDVSSFKIDQINSEINLVTDKNYTDILRKNRENSRLIISGKEVDGIVKKLVYYKLLDNNIYSFYLKGNFDSNKVKQLSEKGEFERFTHKLLQYKTNLTPNTIQ